MCVSCTLTLYLAIFGLILFSSCYYYHLLLLLLLLLSVFHVECNMPMEGKHVLCRLKDRRLLVLHPDPLVRLSPICWPLLQPWHGFNFNGQHLAFFARPASGSLSHESCTWEYVRPAPLLCLDKCQSLLQD